MLNNNSVARLGLVHPVLAKKIRTLAEMLETSNVSVIIQVTQGFRTWMQQHVLYIQGREPITEVNIQRANCGLAAIAEADNVVVTNADAGYSWHNYGLAVDVAPFVDGVPRWDDQATWDRVIVVGESLGLISGKSWRDEPHFELTGKYGVSPDDDVRNLYAAANESGSGTQAIWASAGIQEA
jgi:peptidoglycan L-alanyl-D-glutamate endopeptidase CwlK